MLSSVCYEKNVLIIDSIRQSREALKAFMQSLNVARIDTSYYAPDITTKCENIHYDLILLGYDLGEDRKNGQQVLEELRVKKLISRHCAVVMITAEISQSMVLAALEHKPDEYITKPYTLANISKRIEKCLLKKQAMSEIYTAMDNNHYNEVITLCNKMISTNNQYKNECLGIISRQYYELGQYDLAKEIYLTYENKENCQWAIIGLSKIALSHKDYSTAKNYLIKLIESYPYYLSSYDWLAKTYQLLEEPIEAEQILEKAVSISPRSVVRLKNYADQCLANHNFEKATAAYQNTHDIAYHSIHRKPENTINFTETLLEYSEQLSMFQMKQLNNKAFSALKKMTQDFKNPELKVLSLLLTSRLHNKVNDHPSSVNALNEAERLIKQETNEYPAKDVVSIAKHLISLNRRGMAEKIIHALTDSIPKDSTLLPDIAKIVEQPISESNKLEAQRILEVGTALYREGKYNLSIDKLNEALSLFPSHLGIKLNLYQTIIVSMQYEKARDKDAIQAKYLTRELDQLSVRSESYFRYKTLKDEYLELFKEKEEEKEKEED